MAGGGAAAVATASGGGPSQISGAAIEGKDAPPRLPRWPTAPRNGWVHAGGPKHLPPRRHLSDMQAEGEVVRLADPRAYLFRVALNGSGMRARAAIRAARKLVPIVSSHDPFDEVNLREDVRQLLLGLSLRQRAALVLLDLYGYDSQEAARIMGIRPSTVRALATQGRAVLRKGGPNA